jgi:hypothetical protein
MPDEAMHDEAMPAGGGVMRRLGAGHGDLAGLFSALEMAFAPNALQAREELEAQRRIGKRAPSPADPPNLDPGGRPGYRQVVYTWEATG